MLTRGEHHSPGGEDWRFTLRGREFTSVREEEVQFHMGLTCYSARTPPTRMCTCHRTCAASSIMHQYRGTKLLTKVHSRPTFSCSKYTPPCTVHRCTPMHAVPQLSLRHVFTRVYTHVHTHACIHVCPIGTSHAYANAWRKCTRRLVTPTCHLCATVMDAHAHAQPGRTYALL